MAAPDLGTLRRILAIHNRIASQTICDDEARDSMLVLAAFITGATTSDQVHINAAQVFCELSLCMHGRPGATRETDMAVQMTWTDVACAMGTGEADLIDLTPLRAGVPARLPFPREPPALYMTSIAPDRSIAAAVFAALHQTLTPRIESGPPPFAEVPAASAAICRGLRDKYRRTKSDENQQQLFSNILFQMETVTASWLAVRKANNMSVLDWIRIVRGPDANTPGQGQTQSPTEGMNKIVERCTTDMRALFVSSEPTARMQTVLSIVFLLWTAKAYLSVAHPGFAPALCTELTLKDATPGCLGLQNSTASVLLFAPGRVFAFPWDGELSWLHLIYCYALVVPQAQHLREVVTPGSRIGADNHLAPFALAADARGES